MSVIKRAADLVYTFRFIKILNTKWENLPAYKLGLVDAKGKKLKSPRTPEEKSAYTFFHRLVYNIKRLIGQNKLMSIPASFWLLREHCGLTNEELDTILLECGIELPSALNESQSWLLTEGNKLAKGEYSLTNDKLVSVTGDDIIKENDKVIVREHVEPVGHMMGHNIYVVEHVRTKQLVHVSLMEIKR